MVTMVFFLNILISKSIGLQCKERTRIAEVAGNLLRRKSEKLRFAKFHSFRRAVKNLSVLHMRTQANDSPRPIPMEFSIFSFGSSLSLLFFFSFKLDAVVATELKQWFIIIGFIWLSKTERAARDDKKHQIRNAIDFLGL